MTAFLIILHLLACVFVILFVLLQPGARGGVGAAFGGAGGQTVFGGRGANTFLAKLTAAGAVIFMITSISLSYFVSHTTSVMKRKAVPTQTTDDDGKKGDADKPATPSTTAPATPSTTTPAPATGTPSTTAPATPATGTPSTTAPTTGNQPAEPTPPAP